MYNEVVVRRGITTTLPTGVNWEQVPGLMMDVTAAEEGLAWALDTDYEPWIYKFGTISMETLDNGRYWNPVDEGYVYVDVGRNGRVVVATEAGGVHFRNGVSSFNIGGTSWEDISVEG